MAVVDAVMPLPAIHSLSFASRIVCCIVYGRNGYERMCYKRKQWKIDQHHSASFLLSRSFKRLSKVEKRSENLSVPGLFLDQQVSDLNSSATPTTQHNRHEFILIIRLQIIDSADPTDDPAADRRRWSWQVICRRRHCDRRRWWLLLNESHQQEEAATHLQWTERLGKICFTDHVITIKTAYRLATRETSQADQQTWHPSPPRSPSLLLLHSFFLSPTAVSSLSSKCLSPWGWWFTFNKFDFHTQ